jgi:dTDP-4-dehydrorhamnose 3,5-epimerase
LAVQKMKFTELPLSGAYLVSLEPHCDERGFFARTFSAREFRERGLCGDLSECSLSRNSQAMTLRGMHYQCEPYAEIKLIRVMRGRVFDVVVDIREVSPTHGKWFGVELSADNGMALYVPAGFAHGFLTLEDNTDVYYQISDTYMAAAATGFAWNDPSVGIAWPFEPLVISEADRKRPNLGKSDTVKTTDGRAARPCYAAR